MWGGGGGGDVKLETFLKCVNIFEEMQQQGTCVDNSTQLRAFKK